MKVLLILLVAFFTSEVTAPPPPEGHGPHGGPPPEGHGHHGGPPPFIKECMEKLEISKDELHSPEVTQKKACFAECVMEHHPKFNEEHFVEKYNEQKAKCESTGNCIEFNHMKEMAECFETTKPEFSECQDGEVAARCFTKHGHHHGHHRHGGPHEGGPEHRPELHSLAALF